MADTADDMLAQLLANDELYCARNLKIRTKEGAIVPFLWNDSQRKLHEMLEQQKAETGRVRAIVLKGRQQGISTYVASRFFKRTVTGVGKRTMIITHLDSATTNLFGMAKTYYELSDSCLRPAIKANSSTELSFSALRSGYKVATAGSPGAGRSDTIQYLHGSEIAFWPNAEKIMAGLGQTVADMPGSEVILESTANGLSNIFYDMWTLAKSGRSGYMPVFLPWFMDSGYQKPVPPGFELNEAEVEYQETFGLSDEQMAWRHAKLWDDFRGDVDWFNQEYPATEDLAFTKVGHKPLIQTLKVSKARKGEINHRERIGAHVVGVDPARFGDDKTGIIHRQGRVAWGLERIEHFDTMAVAGRCARMLTDDPTIRMMFIDVGGLGAGVYDRLVELKFGSRVTAVNFGSRASDDRAYFNKRSEMWAQMADWLHDDITPLIPDDDVLHADLTAPSYTHSSNGQLKLDPKEKIKKDTKRSPDSGDALALTFAEPVAAQDTHMTELQRRLQARTQRRSAMSA